MKQRVTVTRNTKRTSWFPEIKELVLYKSKVNGAHKVAMRIDVPRGESRVRFVFTDNGVLGNTVSGSAKAIEKAISNGRIKPYVGDVHLSQSA